MRLFSPQNIQMIARNKVRFGLIILGLLLIAISALTEILGLGHAEGLGVRQIALILLGSFIVLIGVFLDLLPLKTVINWLTRSPIDDEELYESSFVGRISIFFISVVWLGLFCGIIEGALVIIPQVFDIVLGLSITELLSLDFFWVSIAVNTLHLILLGVILLPVLLLSKKIHIWLHAIIICYVFFSLISSLIRDKVAVYALFLISLGLAIQCTYIIRKHANIIFTVFRNTLPWLIGFSLFAFISIKSGLWLHEYVSISRLPMAAPDKPNVLVIVIDTLRADHLSSYGYQRETSPNIDRLANEGVLFENAISTSSWTLPAHASILTGLYPHEHGADVNSLNKEHLRIGEIMQSYGYRTGAFSGNYMVFHRGAGFGNGFLYFEDYFETVGSVFRTTAFGHFVQYEVLYKIFHQNYKLGRRIAEDISPSIIRWVEKNSGRPYFAFVNFYDVHDPYTPPQPFRSKYSQIQNPGGLINTDWTMNNNYQTLSSEELQSEIDAYDGAIAYVDYHIGRLIPELQRISPDRELLVIITSDHGELFGEHDLFGHGNSLTLQETHVPLIFWWPNQLPSGESINEVVSISSIPSTILEIIGIDYPTYWSPSLDILWNEEQYYDWPVSYAEIEKQPWAPPHYLSHYGGIISATDSKWHYINHETLGEELYNWLVDLNETVDLSAELEFRDKLEKYRNLIAETRSK
jgi:arylsulfatase A-like enzyme